MQPVACTCIFLSPFLLLLYIDWAMDVCVCMQLPQGIQYIMLFLTIVNLVFFISILMLVHVHVELLNAYGNDPIEVNPFNEERNDEYYLPLTTEVSEEQQENE